MGALLAAACLLFLQDPPKETAAYDQAVAAVKKAREVLAETEGIRAVSFAGIDGSYRLLVSVDEESVRDAVRKVVGYEYEGLRVTVYSPATREAIYAKPKPEESTTTKPKAPKETKETPKGKDVASEDTMAAIRTLEAKEFRSGKETVAMMELLQCDGVREAFGLPEIKRDRKEGRCTYCKRTTIGGMRGSDQVSPVQHITKHREACPFLEERLIDRLPADAITAVKKMAELLAKAKKERK